jgi:hypothetical protein
MTFSGYKCDECEVMKQVSNHWVIGLISGNEILFYPWNDVAADAPQRLHICGPGCAAKVLSKAIEGWSK